MLAVCYNYCDKPEVPAPSLTSLQHLLLANSVSAPLQWADFFFFDLMRKGWVMGWDQPVQMQSIKQGIIVRVRTLNLAGSNHGPPCPVTWLWEWTPWVLREDKRARLTEKILPIRLHWTPANFWFRPLSRRWRPALSCTWWRFLSWEFAYFFLNPCKLWHLQCSASWRFTCVVLCVQLPYTPSCSDILRHF